MLNRCFLQTLLQSVDFSKESFPITLNRAVASQSQLQFQVDVGHFFHVFFHILLHALKFILHYDIVIENYGHL